jgi:hypothetical protein
MERLTSGQKNRLFCSTPGRRLVLLGVALVPACLLVDAVVISSFPMPSTGAGLAPDFSGAIDVVLILAFIVSIWAISAWIVALRRIIG